MFRTLIKVCPSMRIKEVQNWLVMSELKKKILHVFERSKTTHMSEGNGIRLRIMSKYNLVTYQKLIGWTHQF